MFDFQVFEICITGTTEGPKTNKQTNKTKTFVLICADLHSIAVLFQNKSIVSTGGAISSNTILTG